MIPTLETAG